jgi:anti-sigma regulatory factor (Ser/Thr protein kinase)
MTSVTTALPRSPDSVRTARQLVLVETGSLGAQRSDDAALMVSELVSNALMHGTGAISLRIDIGSDELRIEVSDEGDAGIAPSPTRGADGGWGLRIVEELADSWGVLEGSTRVWFKLDQARAAF